MYEQRSSLHSVGPVPYSVNVEFHRRWCRGRGRGRQGGGRRGKGRQGCCT